MKMKILRQEDALRKERKRVTSLAKSIAFRKRAVVPCFYCGEPLRKPDATGDHKHPVSKGGLNVISNIVIACAPCNGRKGSLSIDQFKRLLATEGRRKTTRKDAAIERAAIAAENAAKKAAQFNRGMDMAFRMAARGAEWNAFLEAA